MSSDSDSVSLGWDQAHSFSSPKHTAWLNLTEHSTDQGARLSVSDSRELSSAALSGGGGGYVCACSS